MEGRARCERGAGRWFTAGGRGDRTGWCLRWPAERSVHIHSRAGGDLQNVSEFGQALEAGELFGVLLACLLPDFFFGSLECATLG